MRVILGVNIGVVLAVPLGLYGDTGKENGN